MSGPFLEWFSTAPSPWDCISAIAAAGALWVSFLDRRDRRQDLEPIFEPSALLGSDGRVYFKVKVRNNFAHGIKILNVTLEKPRSGRLAIKRGRTEDGRVGPYVEAVDRTVEINSDLKPGGESPTQAGMMRLGWGDTAWFEFAGTFESSAPRTIILSFQIKEKLAGKSARAVKVPVDVTPAASG